MIHNNFLKEKVKKKKTSVKFNKYQLFIFGGNLIFHKGIFLFSSHNYIDYFLMGLMKSM